MSKATVFRHIKATCVVVCQNPKLLFHSFERKVAVLRYLIQELKNTTEKMIAVLL